MSDSFDWKNPDYSAVFLRRAELIGQMRDDPALLKLLRAHYRDSPTGPADFISDWGMTFDPRLVERGLPSTIPFVLFPKQREWIGWVLEKWKSQRPGLSEKSRDCGLSYLAVGLSCTLCLFYDGFSAGFGSRKEEYVDKSTNPKSLFWKARFFMRHIPEEFRGGWLEWRDAPHMRISFPETGSVITGEAGDQIGRGDRQSIYFVDESAFLERPVLVEHSLSQTTNCRIDISSVNGMNNPFAQKRHSGKIDVFIFDWRDDPRKDQAWYERQKQDLDPVTVAQEIDRDYSASVSGILIPGAWVRAAIDAKKKLGIAPSGKRGLSFDVADEGIDKNAICGSYGVEVETIDEWSGKGDDIFGSVQRVFNVCDAEDYDEFDYDADGLGAGVRGDARIINATRKTQGLRTIEAIAFRGSGEVIDPEEPVYPDVKSKDRDPDRVRKNKDYFTNRKAQEWWRLRVRFQKTFRWVVERVPCEPDDIISLNSKSLGPLLQKLVAELSQVTYDTNEVGKVKVDKKPDGMKSPNMGDGVMIRFAKRQAAMRISTDVLQRAAMRGRGR